MRALHRAGWVLLALVVLAVGPAAAKQPAVELRPGIDLSVEPGAGGAKRVVRSARLSGWIDHSVRDGFRGPQVVGGSLLLPRGLSFNGGDLPSCPARLMRAWQSTEGCPPKSVLGWATGGGSFADSVGTAVVDGFTDPDFVFVNGGALRIWGFLTIYAPALLREPVAFDIRPLGGRRWSHRVDFEIPSNALNVGGPVRLRAISLELDGIRGAPGYLTFDRRCPKRGHLAYAATLTFRHGDGMASESSRRGQLDCTVERRSRCNPARCPRETVGLARLL